MESMQLNESLPLAIKDEIDNFLRKVLQLQAFCKSALMEKFVKDFSIWEIMGELAFAAENVNETNPPDVFFDNKEFSPEISNAAFEYIQSKLGKPLTFGQVVELINNGGICIKVGQDCGLSAEVYKPSDHYSAETHESDMHDLKQAIENKEKVYFAAPSATTSDRNTIQATFSVSIMDILGNNGGQVEKRTEKKILYLSWNRENISDEDLFKMAEFLEREIKDSNIAVFEDFITLLRLQDFLRIHPDIEIIDYGSEGTRTIDFIQRARQNGAFDNIRFIRINNAGHYEEILPDGKAESRFKKVCSDCPALADTHYVPNDDQTELN